VGSSSHGAVAPPAWPPWRARALAALSVATGCASGAHGGARVAWWVAALAALTSLAVLYRAMARRHAQRETAAWNDALQVADLTRAGVVGEMQAWVDRELGTPIASLLDNLGAARRLLTSAERGSLPDAVVAVDEARSEAERAALVLRRMGLLFGASASRREPLDLNEVAREALRLAGRHAATRGVTLRAALDEHLPPTRGDAAQILQVAVTLLLRAVDSAARSRPRAVLVRTARGSEGIELAVGDSGAAISEVDRVHLFDVPLASRDDGIGRGIAITRSIVEAHGGQVVAERPESGALFRVVLPAGECYGDVG
jgi:C4-dicarboxylate-specific signal transduction histidine kinase